MIIGEEQADDGAVSLPRKLTIGYFRQEVDEMSGRSVLDEAIAGSGRLGDLHHQLTELEHSMSDPDRAAEMESILDRFGHVQEEYQHLGGYELEARAREVLAGLGFEADQIDLDVGGAVLSTRQHAVRGWGRSAFARTRSLSPPADTPCFQ